jgi:ferritin-like protein
MIVGFYNGNIFESLPDHEDAIQTILSDAEKCGISVEVKQISDEEFNILINPLPSEEEIIKAQLEELDRVLPRCVEDLIASQGIDTTTLPQIMQDRLKQKQELRTRLQDLNS